MDGEEKLFFVAYLTFCFLVVEYYITNSMSEILANEKSERIKHTGLEI